MHRIASVRLILLTCASIAYGSACGGRAEPFGRAEGGTPVSHIARGPSTEKAIHQFETRVREDPRDYLSYAILGELHARNGRDRGDLASFRRAEQALREALARKGDNPGAQVGLAAILASQHKFGDALALARAVYEKDPQNLGALTVLADASLETGDYRAGEEYLNQLARRAPDNPPVLVRQAHLAEIQGRDRMALQLFERASVKMRDAEFPEDYAWYEARIGQFLFHHGCLAKAAERSQTALKAFKGYYIGLIGLAEVRAAQGRRDEAASLFVQAIAATPEPEPRILLGDLRTLMGDRDAAAQEYARAEEAARSSGVNEPPYYRVLAEMYANRSAKLPEALALARQDLAMRHDSEGYSVLAWAHYKNGQLQEAQRAIEEAIKQGTNDAELYYYAGMIYDALGQRDKARASLERAFRIAPYLIRDDGRQAFERLGGHAPAGIECPFR